MRSILMIATVLWTVALSSPDPVTVVETRTTVWASGHIREQGTYLRDVRHGEFRAWHRNGRLAELRNYVDGREAGRQQAWTEAGVLFLNYEVRDGRRYGLVNSKPCLPGNDAPAEATVKGEMS